MSCRKSGWACAALAVLFLLQGTSFAQEEAFEVGDRLEPFSLEDQHGEEHRLGPDIRVILYSRDREGGSVMSDAMEGRDGAFLTARGVVYVNDISAMPGLVTRLFALPSMRRRAYPILLDREGELTARFPDRSDAATLIMLDDSSLTSIEYFDDSSQLGARLQALKPESGDLGRPD
ncbi:MAG: hypothetical protein P8Q97_00475 [Myxococcota bacterium]|jgi:hypothetical protein|nr:hypothetical protein [Myxococcota bacterium]